MGVVSTLPWWFWFVSAACFGTWGLVVVLTTSTRLGVLMIGVLSALVAAGASSSASSVADHSNILHWIGTDRVVPATIRGVVQTSGQGWRTIRVTSVNHTGGMVPIHGGVRVTGVVDQLSIGDEVDVQGRLRCRWRGRWVASMVVVNKRHVDILRRSTGASSLRRLIQRRSAKAMTEPPVEQGLERDLVAALTLGRRSTGWNRLVQPFRLTGTAHLLAVSGLHVAILCAGVGWMCRSIGFTPRGVALSWSAAAMVMMIVADIRTPLLRASMMVIGASVFLGCRWRLSSVTLVSAAALIIQMSDPLSVMDIGFQLSFSVVWSFVTLLPRWERRVCVQGIRKSSLGRLWRASSTAWLIATPISVHHFGMFSLLGVPCTMVLLPLTGGVLLLGYTRLLIGWIDGVGTVIGLVLQATAWALFEMADLLSRIPGASMNVEPPGWNWVLLVVGSSSVFIVSTNPRHRLAAAITTAGLWVALWLMSAA